MRVVGLVDFGPRAWAGRGLECQCGGDAKVMGQQQMWRWFGRVCARVRARVCEVAKRADANQSQAARRQRFGWLGCAPPALSSLVLPLVLCEPTPAGSAQRRRRRLAAVVAGGSSCGCPCRPRRPASSAPTPRPPAPPPPPPPPPPVAAAATTTIKGA